jgi:hypothetical protein
MSNTQIWQTLWRMSRVLISATFLAQILTYLCIPFLSRLYLPIQFGELGIFIALTTAGALIGTCRMESWLMQITPDEQDQYWKWGIRNLSITSLVLGIGAALIVPYLFPHMSWKSMMVLLPLGIFFQGIFNLLIYRTGAIELQKQHAKLKIINAVLANTLMIVCYWTGPFNGLIQGWVLGQAIAVIWIYQKLPKFANGHSVIGISQILHLPFRPQWLTAQALLENFQAVGLSAWIGWVYGPLPASLFFMSWRLLQAPINLISNTLYLSQYHVAQAWHTEKKNYIPMMDKAVLALSIASGIALLLWWWTGPELITYILGNNWSATSEVIHSILPWMIAFFILSPFSFLMLMHHKSHWLLTLTIIDSLQKILILSNLFDLSFIDALQLSSYISMLIILVQWWIGRKAEINFVAP